MQLTDLVSAPQSMIGTRSRLGKRALARDSVGTRIAARSGIER